MWQRMRSDEVDGINRGCKEIQPIHIHPEVRSRLSADRFEGGFREREEKKT